MKRALKAVAMFIYTVSGAKIVVEAVKSAIFRYKLRVRMVPVSYKLFILIVGMTIGGSSVYVHNEYPNMLQEQKMTFENTRVIEKVEAKEFPKVDRVKELSEIIYQRESTSGKNNYSKCEAVGKYNGIGYGISGNGKYMCFESHDEEMQVLRGWLITKIALGYTEKEMLCLYSGSNYKECQ